MLRWDTFYIYIYTHIYRNIYIYINIDIYIDMIIIIITSFLYIIATVDAQMGYIPESVEREMLLLQVLKVCIDIYIYIHIYMYRNTYIYT
jgi:hypothetical protein